MSDNREAILILLLFNIFKISYELELMVNGTLLPCIKRDKDNFIPPFHIIEDCHRKIRLIINIQNSGKSAEGMQYIYVKEVSDPNTGLKMRLLNPLVLQLRQDQVILAYPFKYLSAVNGKVSEIVVNKENTKNYSGCDDTSSISPTCGIKFDKGVAVPYSEGFCCFCPGKPVNVKQIRGGQDCSLQTGPQDAKGQKYKASAHCLHFSDIWFSVSALGDPIIIHNLYLQVFNQRHLTNRSSVWVSLTQGQQFEMGPKTLSQYDDNHTIVVTYMTASPRNGTIVFSADNNRLLIPQTLPGIGVDKLPPVIKNGATDYLILSKSIINSKGDECDKAGVSYEAFVKQRDRCKVIKDTCLKNQPLDFWAGDDEKRKSQQKGRYILENYATPYKDPIIVDLDTKEHWLALEYHEKHSTVLTVELNADDITPLSVGSDAQITSVITGGFEKKIEFSVTITNNGLLEAHFSVQVVDCEFKVHNSNNVTQAIPPQMLKMYTLISTPGNIALMEKFICTVVVSSKLYGVVASRDVVIKPLGRCICSWHCRCSCLGESHVCQPLSEKNYHCAGFKGSLPILTTKSDQRMWIWTHVFLTLLIILIIFLILGVIKAIVGLLIFEKVSNVGLKSLIYRPGFLQQYTESELQNYNVVYDEEGYPVHPVQKYRTKALRHEVIFLLNIVFFLIWPYPCIYKCWYGAKKEPRISYNAFSAYTDSENSSDEEPPVEKIVESENSVRKVSALETLERLKSKMQGAPETERSRSKIPRATEIPERSKSKISRAPETLERSKSKIPHAHQTLQEPKRSFTIKVKPVRQSLSDSALSTASVGSLVSPLITEQWQTGAHKAAAVTMK